MRTRNNSGFGCVGINMGPNADRYDIQLFIKDVQANANFSSNPNSTVFFYCFIIVYEVDLFVH